MAVKGQFLWKSCQFDPYRMPRDGFPNPQLKSLGWRAQKASIQAPKPKLQSSNQPPAGRFGGGAQQSCAARCCRLPGQRTRCPQSDPVQVQVLRRVS